GLLQSGKRATTPSDTDDCFSSRQSTSPGLPAGAWLFAGFLGSEPVEDLVGPEALETLERLVEAGELVGRNPADLLDRAHVLLVKQRDDVAHFTAALGELDAHGTAVDARALMIEEAHLDQLLEIVGHVRAEIVAARAQLTGRQLLIADVEQQQRLHRIDVGTAAAVELIFDDVEQTSVQPLDQGQGLEIERLDVVEAGLTLGRLHHFG